MSKLDGIVARAEAFETHGTPGRHAPEDRKDLLAALRAVEETMEALDYGAAGLAPLTYQEIQRMIRDAIQEALA